MMYFRICDAIKIWRDIPDISEFAEIHHAQDMGSIRVRAISRLALGWAFRFGAGFISSYITSY